MKRAASIVLRVALGAVFLVAALSKVPDLRQFAEEVANYQILPPHVVPYAALLFPGVELALGLALIAGVYARAAAVLASAMLVGFIAALSQALVRGINLKCGCFGGADLATWGTVARDVVLLALAIATAWLASSSVGWTVRSRAERG